MPTPVDQLDLPTIDPFAPGFDLDPHTPFAEARRHHWLARSPIGYVTLTYAATQQVLRDKRFRFANDLGLDGTGEAGRILLERSRRNLLNRNGEPHTRLRRLVTRAFTPRAVERYRSFARATIDDLLDPVIAGGRAELVTAVTEPFPIRVICELVGAPPEDWPRFSVWVDRLFRRLNFQPGDVDDVLAAQLELDSYLRELIDHRRSRPADDLLSDLIRAEEAGDRLTVDEIVILLDNILSAGTDTTRNQLATAAYLFALHPDQRARLAEDRALAPGAVDEVMRSRPVVAGTLRVADDIDVEVEDVMFPAGTIVAPGIMAANRDPAVYPDPDRFDIARRGVAPLSFGGGPHYCLGANLARVELEESLHAVAFRLPGLAVDGEVAWRPLVGIGGPARLPLRWDVPG